MQTSQREMYQQKNIRDREESDTSQMIMISYQIPVSL